MVDQKEKRIGTNRRKMEEQKEEKTNKQKRKK